MPNESHNNPAAVGKLNCLRREADRDTELGKPEYRGPIAIHAAKDQDKKGERIRHIVARAEQYGIVIPDMPFGAVIAIADLVDCVKVIGFDQFANSPILDRKEWLLQNAKETAFGDYSIGRYAWILDNIRQIDPVPARGMQRLWEWEP